MFIMMGINSQSKELDFNQMVICNSCGSYGRYIVYMTYTVFSIFFIPIFKWNKQYYVKMSCCDTMYQLNPNIGKEIEYGNTITIQESDLTVLQKSNNLRCPKCGYLLNSEFEYCPKCGTKIES